MAQSVSSKDKTGDDDWIVENHQSQNQLGFPNNLVKDKLMLAAGILFFAGLFVLAVGAGLFLFKGKSSGDIEIISEGDTADQSQIVVHIDGAVANPGVYQLPTGSRIADAVEKAGGLTNQADRTRINLAARVSDGQKIQIARVSDPGSGGSSGSVGGQSVSALVNVNTATEAELDKLPGVGPATSAKIIASRPYNSPEDLLTKKAVNNSTYEKIKEMITF